jgi:hypothetical protein
MGSVARNLNFKQWQPEADHYYPSMRYAFSDLTSNVLARELTPHRISFAIANALVLVIGNRIPDMGCLSTY